VPATKKTPPKKAAAENTSFEQTVNDALAKLGIEPNSRTGFNPASPDVIYAVRYKNIQGLDIEFSVAHKNRAMLEDDLLKLPVSLIPCVDYKNTLAEVEWAEGKRLERHYEFNDWFRMMSLLGPGTWYYLGSPEEYKIARAAYVKLDPLKRLHPAARAA
jgi:hypothetical protein